MKLVNYTEFFFNEQPVYKQVALGWQIAKQLSGPNPVSLSNNKNYRYRKLEFFLCNKRKIVVKLITHQNSAVSKALLGNFKISDHKYWFWILQIIVVKLSSQT